MSGRAEVKESESVETPSPRPAHRRDIQGLRALAVTLVVLYHAGFSFSGGFIGVDVFFVLSGFVITRGMLWEVEATGSVDLRRFFARRIARILPAATLTTAVVLVALPFFAPFADRPLAIRTALAGTLFNANNYLLFSDGFGDTIANYFDSSAELNPFLHFWSLSVEEQFYFFFPVLVFALTRRSTTSSAEKRNRLLRWFVGIGAISLVASLLVVGSLPGFAFYLSPLRAWEFLVGAALVWVEPRRLTRTAANAMLALGFIVLMAAALTFSDGSQFPGWRATIPVGASALMIHAATSSTNVVHRALTHRISNFVGRISYAWYLWHWPLLVFVKATFPNSTVALVLAVIGSFAFAAFSTLAIEEPLRNNPTVKSRTPAVLMTCFVIALGGWVIGIQLTNSTSNSEEAATFNEVFRPFSAQGARCGSVESPPDGCSASSATPKSDVVLLGDSTALQLFDGAQIAAHDGDFAIRLAYENFCASNRFESRTYGVEFVECGHFWDDVFDDLHANPPDTIVVAISLNAYLKSQNAELRIDGGEWASDTTQRQRIVERGLVEALTEMSNIADRVVYVGVTPNFSGWHPRDCSYAAWSLQPESCAPAALAWSDLDVGRADAQEVQDRLLAIDGVEFLNLDDAICPGTTCGPVVDGQWIFRDNSHITSDTSERLAPLLADAIAG